MLVTIIFPREVEGWSWEEKSAQRERGKKRAVEEVQLESYKRAQGLERGSSNVLVERKGLLDKRQEELEKKKKSRERRYGYQPDG